MTRPNPRPEITPQNTAQSAKKSTKQSKYRAQTFIHAARVFTGLEDGYRTDQTVVVDSGVFSFVGASATAPKPKPGDTIVQAFGKGRERVLMPGLVDVHTHLVFGNARSEEDIDFWVAAEFRALRSLFFSQHVLAAGYASIAVPGDAGNSSISVRDSINADLFDGPRIAASSHVIANRHILNDWFPEHVGTPEYATGRLCTTRDAQIDEVRRQAKACANVIKIAMDGTHFREDGSHARLRSRGRAVRGSCGRRFDI